MYWCKKNRVWITRLVWLLRQTLYYRHAVARNLSSCPVPLSRRCDWKTWSLLPSSWLGRIESNVEQQVQMLLSDQMFSSGKPWLRSCFCISVRRSMW